MYPSDVEHQATCCKVYQDVTNAGRMQIRCARIFEYWGQPGKLCFEKYMSHRHTNSLIYLCMT